MSKQESATKEMLRRRILDEAGLPYVHVKLDPRWHLRVEARDPGLRILHCGNADSDGRRESQRRPRF
jgi:hypothetical protein